VADHPDRPRLALADLGCDAREVGVPFEQAEERGRLLADLLEELGSGLALRG
jgi:hypothetical protein